MREAWALNVKHEGRTLQEEGQHLQAPAILLRKNWAHSHCLVPGCQLMPLSCLWSSFVGLFLRHMILAYSKLSFSQVFKLYTALQQYFQNGEKKTVEDAEMDREDAERQMEKEELDVSVRWVGFSCCDTASLSALLQAVWAGCRFSVPVDPGWLTDCIQGFIPYGLELAGGRPKWAVHG